MPGLVRQPATGEPGGHRAATQEQAGGEQAQHDRQLARELDDLASGVLSDSA